MKKLYVDHRAPKAHKLHMPSKKEMTPPESNRPARVGAKGKSSIPPMFRTKKKLV